VGRSKDHDLKVSLGILQSYNDMKTADREKLVHFARGLRYCMVHEKKRRKEEILRRQVLEAKLSVAEGASVRSIESMLSMRSPVVRSESLPASAFGSPSVNSTSSTVTFKEIHKVLSVQESLLSHKQVLNARQQEMIRVRKEQEKRAAQSTRQAGPEDSGMFQLSSLEMDVESQATSGIEKHSTEGGLDGDLNTVMDGEEYAADKHSATAAGDGTRKENLQGDVSSTRSSSSESSSESESDESGSTGTGSGDMSGSDDECERASNISDLEDDGTVQPEETTALGIERAAFAEAFRVGKWFLSEVKPKKEWETHEIGTDDQQDESSGAQTSSSRRKSRKQQKAKQRQRLGQSSSMDESFTLTSVNDANAVVRSQIISDHLLDISVIFIGTIKRRMQAAGLGSYNDLPAWHKYVLNKAIEEEDLVERIMECILKRKQNIEAAIEENEQLINKLEEAMETERKRCSFFREDFRWFRNRERRCVEKGLQIGFERFKAHVVTIPLKEIVRYALKEDLGQPTCCGLGPKKIRGKLEEIQANYIQHFVDLAPPYQEPPFRSLVDTVYQQYHNHKGPRDCVSEALADVVDNATGSDLSAELHAAERAIELWQPRLRGLQEFWKRFDQGQCFQALSADDFEQLIYGGRLRSAEGQNVETLELQEEARNGKSSQVHWRKNLDKFRRTRSAWDSKVSPEAEELEVQEPAVAEAAA